jgi:hypothetical protein
MINNALNDVSIGYAGDIALYLAVVHCFGMYLAPCSKKTYNFSPLITWSVASQTFPIFQI